MGDALEGSWTGEKGLGRKGVDSIAWLWFAMLLLWSLWCYVIDGVPQDERWSWAWRGLGIGGFVGDGLRNCM